MMVGQEKKRFISGAGHSGENNSPPLPNPNWENYRGIEVVVLPNQNNPSADHRADSKFLEGSSRPKVCGRGEKSHATKLHVENRPLKSSPQLPCQLFHVLAVLALLSYLTNWQSADAQQNPQRQSPLIHNSVANGDAARSKHGDLATNTRVLPNEDGSCGKGSCYPATGDLLIGRDEQLGATSTCGLEQRSRYCIVSHLEDEKKCFYCDSRRPYHPVYNPYSHRIQNVISSSSSPVARRKAWWQAENGLENVSIRLDMEAEFHFTHLIMTFKTFRPAAMLVEKSSDFGQTWQVMRYFAYDCRSAFPGSDTGQLKRVSDVVCISRYSNVAPSTAGEIIHRARPPYLELENPYSQEVQNLLKMTNLRINFTRLHTLGDNLLDNREEVREKYYYALYDMVVRGSCSCYGHASRCIPLRGQAEIPNMVYGQCECNHHTRGLNCDKCEDFYNDVPWKPAHGTMTNACKRCECNRHATRCHFDPVVYQQSGFVSGGICDDCQHDTMGNKCHQCRTGYYRQPGIALDDPVVCRACQCHFNGSLNNGECDSHQDDRTGLVAGRCHCKRYVDGDRCDTCKDGYWNMLPNNPEGCEACTCLIIGTVGNLGCDKSNGKCSCKPYVTGSDCESCLPGYWGLSREDDQGCKKCDCDLGGSLEINCDQVSGECRCKPEVTGRRCDQPRIGSFCAPLDYYTYEAERTQMNEYTTVMPREQDPKRPITWTGDGFVRVREGGFLTFNVRNIVSQPLAYQLIVRYELPMPRDWEEVIVSFEEIGPARNPYDNYDQNYLQIVSGGSRKSLDGGDNYCTGYSQPSVQVTYLSQSSRYAAVALPYCLQSDREYVVRVEFSHYETVPRPEAHVFLDSVAFVPTIDSMPIFREQGGAVSPYNNAAFVMRNEFDRFRCREMYLHADRSGTMPEMCNKYLCSVALSMHGHGIDCSCDPTGSVSSVCNVYGGQCQCKSNVVGQRCDRCAPGTYGFGPSGCTTCNCNGRGSLDSVCDVYTGQCKCIPGVVGQRCDTCQEGFWNFPLCQRCECNGHADSCDQVTGTCQRCRENTDGPSCDRCTPSYYGDPRIEVNIPCRACMCPGMASGNQFADSCYLDPASREMVCRCKPGYLGRQCDRCTENFYGRPLIPGGSCSPCFCNDNTDASVPGNCDSETGECLKCVYNTHGFNCERCKGGYFGDALQHNCVGCVCNSLGTDVSKGHCDPINGQCPCFPNVTGVACDTCSTGYWKLSSGTGCEPCGCCAESSHADQCNLFDGQCRCKAGFGGRTCCDCEDNFWGDPKVQCFPCQCNTQGSTSYQCDRRTGKCTCQPGMTGDKCDQCARGTIGQVPYCRSCGECFDNWDVIITELLTQTESLMISASEVKDAGVVSAYTTTFQTMENKIRDVEVMLKEANVTTSDLNRMATRIEELRQKLIDRASDIELLVRTNSVLNTDIDLSREKLDSIKRAADELKNQTKSLEDNTTRIQEADLEGAFSIIRESWEKTGALRQNVSQSMLIANESLRIRERVKGLLEKSAGSLEDSIRANQNNLSELDTKIFKLREGRIGEINTLVCDGTVTPCDPICGGAGCGKCGGLSCDNGALTKAQNALELSKEAEAIFQAKRIEAQELLNNVEVAEKESKNSLKTSEQAYHKAWQALNSSQSAMDKLKGLVNKSESFVAGRGATPTEIRTLAESVLRTNISLSPKEITNLANEINRTISSLTKIDEILRATDQDISKATELNAKAAKASDHANAILKMAEKVKSDLNETKGAMDQAQLLLNLITGDINGTSAVLDKIKGGIEPTQNSLEESVSRIENLKAKLRTIKSKSTKANLDLTTASKQALQADALSSQAEKALSDLEVQYSEASTKISSETMADSELMRKAAEFRLKAQTLSEATFGKLKTLEDLQRSIDNHESHFKNLTQEVAELNKKMREYLPQINDKAVMYRTCNP